MRIHVRHATTYSYAEPARSVVQLLRMTPSQHDGQNVQGWRINIDADGHLREGRDGFGNIVHRLYTERSIPQLTVEVTGEVETRDTAGVLLGLDEPLPPEIFLRDTELTRAGPDLSTFARDVAAGAGDALAAGHKLLGAIHQGIVFDTRATDTATSADDAFALKRGVCQDLGHIFIACARLLDIPARYISGHLVRSDGQTVQEAAHAWAEILVPGLGWVAFDPANGVSATDAYIRVATGLDYRDAAPVRGARYGGGAEHMTVELRVAEAGRQVQA